MRYVSRNHSKILEIGDLTENLPLAVNIISKQLLYHSIDIRTMLHRLKNEKLNLKLLRYENSDLYSNINISFKHLNIDMQKLLSSTCIFSGSDFSSSALAYVNKISKSETINLLGELVNFSFVEKSTKGRFRIHPVIKVFLQQKIEENRKIYDLLASFYIKDFQPKKSISKSKRYQKIDIELDNVLFTFNKLCKIKNWKKIIDLWSCMSEFLWDTGYWFKVEKAAVKGLKIAETLKNSYFIAYAKQRLGCIYQSKKQFGKARILLEESFKIFQNLSDPERIGDTLTYIGTNYCHLKKYKKSIKYLYLAYNLTQRIKDFDQYAIILSRLGEVKYILGDYKNAEYFFKESINQAKKTGRRAGATVWNNFGLALIKNKEKNILESKNYLNKANKEALFLGIKIGKQNHYPNPILPEIIKLNSQLTN